METALVVRTSLKSLAVAAAIALVSADPGRSNVIWSEDFSSEPHTATNLNTANMFLTVTADPLASGRGDVVAVNDTGANTANGAFQEVRAFDGRSIALPGNVTPGVDPFIFTLDYMIPSASVGLSNTTDRISVIVRFLDTTGVTGNSGQRSVSLSSINLNSVTLDTWTTVTLSNLIPAVDLSNNAVIALYPIISWIDNPAPGTGDAPAGIIGYLDNLSLVAIPEPRTAALLTVGTALLAASLARRRR